MNAYSFSPRASADAPAFKHGEEVLPASHAPPCGGPFLMGTAKPHRQAPGKGGLAQLCGGTHLTRGTGSTPFACLTARCETPGAGLAPQGRSLNTTSAERLLIRRPGGCGGVRLARKQLFQAPCLSTGVPDYVGGQVESYKDEPKTTDTDQTKSSDALLPGVFPFSVPAALEEGEASAQNLHPPL